jgi:hypothetical protein
MPAPTATGVSGQGGHEPPPQSDDARRGELKEAVAPQHAAEADWHDVQTRLLRLYESGEPFTSQRDLAVRLSCSAATINKAINDSPKLRGWMARQSKRSFKAQSLNEVVLDGNPSQRERDPSTAGIPQEDIDQIIAELAAKAPPAERARLSALTAQGRQELAELYLEQRAELHVEDDAPGGNRIIGRQP